MDESDRKELSALVVGVLTQSLNDHPNGFTLEEFERFFPEKAEEPRDWYRHYKKNNTLEALECIKETVSLSRNNYGGIQVRLIMKSADSHLVDLIKNQKPSGKRNKRSNARPHFQRVMDSYAMNKRFSRASSASVNYHNRLNYDQSYKRNNSFVKRNSPPPSSEPSRAQRQSWGNEPPRSSPADPRIRQSATSIVPPQIRPPISSSANQTQRVPPRPAPQVASSPSLRLSPQVSVPQKPVEPEVQDPAILHKKTALKQRLIQMLTRKYPEIKILYLNSLYQLEYAETIDLKSLGHKTISALLQDPYFSDSIKINYKSPHSTVSAVNMSTKSNKENIAAGDGNRPNNVASGAQQILNGTEPLSDKSNILTTAKLRYNAIDPFNVAPMLDSIEPLTEVKEPPVGRRKVEETIKYRTMRIIFKDPNCTLKLDDWERRYQLEWNCHMKIQIRDYGFKTLSEFFKHLATELPIKVYLNDSDEWLATTTYDVMSTWLRSQVASGNYRAVMAMNAKYDQIAFPGETYTYSNLKGLPEQEYYQANILTVKSPRKMWLKIRDQKRIEEHLALESSLTSYEDYKKKGIFQVPDGFLKPGFPCVAFDDKEQRWRRAIVIKAPEEFIVAKESPVVCFLVDYAITKTFSAGQLLCISKNHFKKPVDVIFTQLYGVDVDDSFNFATVMLQQYVTPPMTLACKILDNGQSIGQEDGVDYMPKYRYTVTLIDTSQGKDCNLAENINRCTSIPDE